MSALLLCSVKTVILGTATACKEADVASKTGIDGYQWLREVCSNKLLANPIKPGDPGTIVQADESLFNYKPKV